MIKAHQALRSAQGLIALDDADGACNRAYYAMFDAARAALLVKMGRTEADFAKTHRGLINAFSERLVKDGTLSRDLGRSLKRAEEMRLLADYDGDSVGIADAAVMVSDAKIFISAIEKLTV
jgi:uncharacterized protein (UPF0332 family)